MSGAPPLLRLGTVPEDPVTWWDSGNPGERGEGVLADAAAALDGREVVVLVPAEQVLLSTAQVPGRNRSQRMRALPYALEEELAEDVEDTHFALPPVTPIGPLPVCVVARSRMAAWLEALAEARIRPAALVPDVLALPRAGDEWALATVNGHALVRTAANGGFAADADNLATLLALAREEPGQVPPERLRLLGDGAVGEAPRLAAAAAGLEVESAAEQRAFLAWAAEGYDRRTTINLLQGEYARDAGRAGRWRPWLLVLALAAVWLAVEGGVQVADYARLKQAEATLEARIASLFAAALPDARRMVNPRVQVERRLAALEGAATDAGGLLPLLHAGGQVLKAHPDVKITALNYRGDTLYLSLELPDLQRLDGLKSALAQATARTVTIQGATADGGRVRARLALEGRRP